MEKQQVRVTLTLAPKQVVLMDQLAGSERRRSQYIGELLEREGAAKKAAFNVAEMDLSMMQALIQALWGKVMILEGAIKTGNQ